MSDKDKAGLAYGPGDPIYDAAIVTRNASYDFVLETSLNAMNFRTKRDRFGNVTLLSTTTAGNAVWKATDAMALIEAVSIKKLKPIEDTSSDAMKRLLEALGS